MHVEHPSPDLAYDLGDLEVWGSVEYRL